MDKTMEYMLEVARCGGISRAARNLYITPSALSKFVLQREAELGFRVFNRRGSRFTLTYPGERYIEMLRRRQEEERKMERELRRLADLYAGRLRVGFQMSLAEWVVGWIVPEVQDRCPSIRLSLAEADTGELLRMLKANELDVALTMDAPERDAALCYRDVTPSPVALAAARGGPLEARAVPREGFAFPWLPEEAIREEKFILDRDGRSLRRFAPGLAEGAEGLRRSEVTVTNARTALLCVEQDLGVIVLPELLVRAMRFQDRVALYSFGPEQSRQLLTVVSDPRSPLLYEIGEFARIVGENLKTFNRKVEET